MGNTVRIIDYGRAQLTVPTLHKYSRRPALKVPSPKRRGHRAARHSNYSWR